MLNVATQQTGKAWTWLDFAHFAGSEMQRTEHMRMVLTAIFLLGVPLSIPVSAQSGTSTKIVFVQELEEQARKQLRRILAEYDLDAWIFTREVKIEHGVIPHSHPVLTLSTSNLNDDEQQLATFLHEQTHWFEDERAAASRRAIEALRQMYPDVPDHEEIGTRSEHSTYVHLIINWLELDAMRRLVGNEHAREILSQKGYYEWIYDRVLEDTEAIGAILAEHDLVIRTGEK